MMKGVLVVVAARCMPTSPSGCSATCSAVGATNSGKSRFSPSTVVRVSTAVVVNRRARDDIDPAEGVAIAPDRELRIGAVRGVVVDGLRDVTAEHGLEVENRRHLGEAGDAPMVAEGPGVALGGEERRPGDQCRQAQPARRAGSDFVATAVRLAPRRLLPDQTSSGSFSLPAGRLRRETTLRRLDAEVNARARRRGRSGLRPRPAAPACRRSSRRSVATRGRCGLRFRRTVR